MLQYGRLISDPIPILNSDFAVVLGMVAIYSAIELGISPQINAISTIIVAVVSIALFIAWRLGAFRPEPRTVVVEDARAD